MPPNPHEERYTVSNAPSVGTNAISFNVGAPRDAQGDGYIGSVILYRNNSKPTRTGIESPPDSCASVYLKDSDFTDAGTRIKRGWTVRYRSDLNGSVEEISNFGWSL